MSRSFTRARRLVPALLFALAACTAERPHGGLRILRAPRPPTDGRYALAHLIGQASLPDFPRNLLSNGPALYGFMVFRGMAVLDVADPASPRLTAQFGDPILDVGQELLNNYLNGMIDGDRLFVINRHVGLSVFNVADPLRPVFERNEPAAGTRAVSMIRVGEDFFIAAGGQGLLRMTSGHDFPAASQSVLTDYDHVKQVAFYPPHYLLLADNFDGGLQILDLRESTRPRPVHVFQTGSFVDSLVPFDGFVATASRSGGLIVIDLRNPLAPFIASYFYPRERASVKCMARWGERGLVVGTQGGWLDLFEFDSADHIFWLGRVPVGGQMTCLAVQDDLAYVGVHRVPSAGPRGNKPQLLIFRLEVLQRSPLELVRDETQSATLQP